MYSRGARATVTGGITGVVWGDGSREGTVVPSPMVDVDLFDREPVLPLPTALPPPLGAPGQVSPDGGDLTWSELLSVCDEAGADYPRWRLHHLKCTEHDPRRYQVHLIHEGAPPALLPAAYEYFWVERYVDWARLRHTPLPPGWVLP